MKSFTVEEFENRFDELFSRVESGESFIIKSESGDAVICPFSTSRSSTDDLIKLHTEHNDGC
jgi:hypothetical protein